MAEPITMQKLTDASFDADTLEAAVNEDKMVMSRLGKEYASVPMASRLLVENNLLGARPFSTYAKMTAPDVDPPLVDGNYAVVTNDGALGANGVYEKVDGVWVYLKYNKRSSAGGALWFKTLSSTVVNFDKETRTLSWSGEILTPTQLRADGRIKLGAYSLQFSTESYQVLWLDLRDINKPDFSAATSLKVSTYNPIEPDSFQSKEYQLPIFYCNKGVGSAVAGFFENELADKSLYTATKTRFKKDTATKMSIYQKGRNKNFIEFNFEHEVNAYDPTNAFGNLDCWRIKGAWECNQNLERILEIAQGGAWEMAIREKGVEDSVGTYHGDEVLKSAYFIIDGRVYLAASLFDVINPASFEFVQESDLYRCNTQTKIAKVLRRYEWQDNGFVLTQRIEWMAAVVVQDAWLAMIPSYRKSDNGNGLQVTDSAMRTSNGIVTRDVNMSVPDFAMVDTPFYDGDVAKLWGVTSGIAFDLEIIESPNLPEQTLHFSSAAAYNKFYFDVTGYRKNDYLTAIDEVWKCKAKFGVYTAN